MKLFIKILIAIFTVSSLVIVMAGLTKAGYIENYLGIGVLSQPEDFSSNSNYIQRNGEIDVSKIRIDKPVIYLYPTKTEIVTVKLDYKGKIIADYPEYDYSIGGWEVEANPDGRLINLVDNKEYSYLFWEGSPSEKIDWDMSTGFVIKGSDTRVFLQEKLSEIGLSPNELNEFIVYWYPKLMNNNYNQIHFATDQYTDQARLDIEPTPDSILRVFMVYKPLESEIRIKEQKFQGFKRDGFSVVEWGGTLAE